MPSDLLSILIQTELINPISIKKYAFRLQESKNSLFCTKNVLYAYCVLFVSISNFLCSPSKTLVVIGSNPTRLKSCLIQFICKPLVNTPVDNFGQGG